MWSEGEKVKTAVRNKMLAAPTRLNFSLIEAESQSCGLFLDKEDKQELT